VDMSLDLKPRYNQLITEINSQRKPMKTYENSWPSKPNDRLSIVILMVNVFFFSFKIGFWTSLDYNQGFVAKVDLFPPRSTLVHKVIKFNHHVSMVKMFLFLILIFK
jgi:hypothetical protein